MLILFAIMRVPNLISALQVIAKCELWHWAGKPKAKAEGKFQFHNDVPVLQKEGGKASKSVIDRTPQRGGFEGPVSINDHPSRQKCETVVEGPWAGLIEEALAQIFDRLPFEDRLRTVPLVCQGWRRVARSPSSWRNVDMDSWMEAKADESYDWEFEAQAQMNRIVQAVVDLSEGQLRQLRTGYCTNESVNYIADNCPQLRDLSIRNSFTVDDESAKNLARKCPRLVKLDLSDCYNISKKSLESFGINCPFLAHFIRNMTDIINYDEVAAPRGDEEAEVIAKHMVRLKVLQMRRMISLTDSGLMSIALRCPQLETLDLACCTDLSPKALDSVIEKCPKLTNFVRPIKPRMHVADSKYYVPGIYMLSY